MLISRQFFKETDIDKEELVIKKLMRFEEEIKRETNKIRNVSAGYWIRKIVGTDVFKFRLNNKDRVLFTFVNDEMGQTNDNILFLRYVKHDDQIRKGKAISLNYERLKEIDIDVRAYEEDKEQDKEAITKILQDGKVDLERIDMLVVQDSQLAYATYKEDYTRLNYVSKEQYQIISDIQGASLIFATQGARRYVVLSYILQKLSGGGESVLVIGEKKTSIDTIHNIYNTITFNHRNVEYMTLKQLYKKILGKISGLDTSDAARKIIALKETPIWDYIVIEDMSNMTQVEIKMLMKLAKTKDKIIWAADPNNVLGGAYLPIDYIKDIYQQSQKELKTYILRKNYMKSWDSINTINLLIEEERKYLQQNNYCYKEEGMRQEGEISVLDIKKDQLNKILKSIINKPQIAVVVKDNRTRNKISEPDSILESRILTVEELQGLRYEQIIALDILEQNSLQDIENIRIIMGSSKEGVYLYQENNKVDFLKSVIGNIPRANSEQLSRKIDRIEETKEAWKKEMDMLEEAGQYERFKILHKYFNERSLDSLQEYIKMYQGYINGQRKQKVRSPIENMANIVYKSRSKTEAEKLLDEITRAYNKEIISRLKLREDQLLGDERDKVKSIESQFSQHMKSYFILSKIVSHIEIELQKEACKLSEKKYYGKMNWHSVLECVESYHLAVELLKSMLQDTVKGEEDLYKIEGVFRVLKNEEEQRSYQLGKWLGGDQDILEERSNKENKKMILPRGVELLVVNKNGEITGCRQGVCPEYEIKEGKRKQWQFPRDKCSYCEYNYQCVVAKDSNYSPRFKIEILRQIYKKQGELEHSWEWIRKTPNPVHYRVINAFFEYYRARNALVLMQEEILALHADTKLYEKMKWLLNRTQIYSEWEKEISKTIEKESITELAQETKQVKADRRYVEDLIELICIYYLEIT